MATLVLDQLTKVYKPRGRKAVTAVDRVDLAAKNGEIIGLLGSSGCGKTSTLRMIAGFEDVSQGVIRIGEREIQALPPARRGVAMAFEGYALYPPLKVRDNIGFALLRERTARADIEARVREIAALLEIEPVLDRYPPTISAGQQQRASLARALVRRAPVSLLDEPMSQLEPQLRAILRARIKDYLIEHELTTVFVTHDQTEAIALADRIAVMEQGILQQYASPQALKDEPANLFVAGFIGEPPMNIVACATSGAGEAAALHILGADGKRAFSVPVPDGVLASVLTGTQKGAALRVGVRPHRVELSTRQGLAGRVVSNQWLGDQTHLALDMAGIQVVVVGHGPLQARVGETVPVAFPARALHLFEEASGRALAHGLEQRVAVAA